MSGKHVLITGASSGIGRALALRYAKEGARLELFGRNEARLRETAEACRAAGGEAEYHVADVRDRVAMQAAVAKALEAGPLDVLVSNAGVSSGPAPDQPLEPEETVRAVFAINLFGQLNTVEPAIPSFVARRSGVVAFVGSMMGLRAMHFSPTYCATKAALHSCATSLRAKLAPHGVDVSLIVPGWVDTPMSQRTTAWKASMITDAEAAEIVYRGLEKRRPIIAFPRYMYWALRIIELLPPRLVDFFVLRFSAEVPQTIEKESV
jgi:NAD(P)-dependent dehydrogenase (short-subunit alcohol dehydrogenase family)